MATQAELETRIANDLVPKLINEFTLLDIRDALVASGRLAELRDAVLSNNAREAGGVILRAVRDYAKTQAETEVAGMFSDGSLNVTELSRWLD